MPQTISQIKTVFAFVGERSEIKSFSDCMDKQIIISRGEALIKGVGLGMFQSVTFCCWALIIWVGAVVVTAKRSIMDFSTYASLIFSFTLFSF